MTYQEGAEASRQVLLEVWNVLGAFHNDLVLVGGWVPDLWYPRQGHVGSLDVDIAVSLDAIQGSAYLSIHQRLLDAGYRQSEGTARFGKEVHSREIAVDLVSGQYQAGGKSRTIRINTLQINTLRGLDLAFESYRVMELSGRMPDGSRNTVPLQIVSPAAFLLIKAFALRERRKPKDSYDIAFVLAHHQPSLADLAEQIVPLLSGNLAREGYNILREKFATRDSIGPMDAALIGTEMVDDPVLLREAAWRDAQSLFREIDQRL
ncbi:MAG: nucleotidyl transferase AbiEii/AbiGii toxin family protein [Pirellulaceae bacterium]